jgi:hypothetical protein
MCCGTASLPPRAGLLRADHRRAAGPPHAGGDRALRPRAGQRTGGRGGPGLGRDRGGARPGGGASYHASAAADAYGLDASPATSAMRAIPRVTRVRVRGLRSSSRAPILHVAHPRGGGRQPEGPARWSAPSNTPASAAVAEVSLNSERRRRLGMPSPSRGSASSAARSSLHPCARASEWGRRHGTLRAVPG